MNLNEPLILATCGACSGIITKTIIAPLERVKLLYQVQNYYGKNEYISLRQSLSKILLEDGIKGLYYGNGANIIRILPVYSLKFMFNDLYKTFFLNKNQSIKDITFKQLMMSGMLAGISQSTITYPLETIRTRLSIDNNMGRYNGIINCGIHTVKKEGIKALYKGYSVTFLSTPIYVGLQMSLYEIFKRQIKENNISGNYTILCMLCGASAGLIAQTTAYWGDTIKKQMQTDGIKQKKYTGLYDCVTKIYKKNGIKGFYPGIKLNSIKCIPEASIQFVVYDICKTYLYNYK